MNSFFLQEYEKVWHHNKSNKLNFLSFIKILILLQEIYGFKLTALRFYGRINKIEEKRKNKNSSLFYG